MKKRFLIALIFFGMILYWFYLQQENRQTQLLAGKPAPDFTIVSEKGDRLRLSDLRGRVVLLHFWATWCPPCAGEIPSLEKLYRTLSSQNFTLVALSMDEHRSDVEKFRQRTAFSFPIYFDPSLKVSDRYGTFGLPETYLINQEGVVIKKFIGPQQWESPTYQKSITDLIQTGKN